jgi:hypothetical protein
MIAKTKEYLTPILITLAVLTLSYLLHTKWCGSEMRQSEELWQKRLDLHQTYYPFSIRPFTTYTAIIIKKIFSLQPRESFFILQFFLAAILGPLFYGYLRILSFDRKWANIGVFLLMSAYPILGAHFEPVYTWDDFWVYIFLILTFGSLIKGKMLLSTFFLIVGTFAREQTLLFWPIFALGGYWYCRDYGWWKRTIYLAAPFIIYLPFYYLMWQPFPGRTEYIVYNFANYWRGSDSIFSFLISFGFLWPASALAAGQLLKIKDKLLNSRFLLWGAVLSVLPTLILTFFFTKARETRIFFPPFLFIIPLATIFIQSACDYFRNRMSETTQKILLTSLPIMLAVGIMVSPLIFPKFDFRNCPPFHQQAFGFHLGLMMIMAFYYLLRDIMPKKMR